MTEYFKTFDKGLILPASRSDGGFCLFSPDISKQLIFTRKLRALEIHLPDVLKVPESRRTGIRTCTSLQSTIRRKSGGFEQKISALRAIHIELMDLLNSWQICCCSMQVAIALLQHLRTRRSHNQRHQGRQSFRGIGHRRIGWGAVFVNHLALNCACVGGNSKTPLSVVMLAGR